VFFRLKSLDKNVIPLAEEARQCEERYYAQYLSGEPVPEGPAIVLEEDNVRYTILMDQLKAFFTIDVMKCIKAKAVFHSQPNINKRNLSNINVQWIISE
jgi:hypothetical protein